MGIQDEIRTHIVESILFGEGEGLEVDTSFQDSGIVDSTGMLEIITFVEERFGVTIGDDEVVPENLGTLRDISRFVEQKLQKETSDLSSA
jgi:acyl carrier protein